MGQKTRARRAALAAINATTQPTTPQQPAVPTPRVVTPQVDAQRSAQRGDPISAAQNVEVVVEDSDIDDAAVQTRKDDIEALPTFGEITGLVAVENGITLFITPLRAGAAAECYFNETATATDIGGKSQAMINFVNTRLGLRLAGMDLNTVSIDNVIDCVALRNTSFKNQRCGVFKLRVMESASDGLITALGDDVVITKAFGTVFTHETIISDVMYPGAVIEQIALQNNNLGATFRRDFAIGKHSFIYSVSATLAQSAVITARGCLVELGIHGKFDMYPVERRVTFETIYVYGFAGVASAQADAKGPFADALSCPADMVKIGGVPSTLAGAGTVCSIRFPYSRANNDNMARLLDQGYFKLRHPNVRTFVMEIAVAISPIELQKMLKIKLVKEENEEDSSDDEEVVALELGAPTWTPGAQWVLEPDFDRSHPLTHVRLVGENEEVGRGGGQGTMVVHVECNLHDYGVTDMVCPLDTHTTYHYHPTSVWQSRREATGESDEGRRAPKRGNAASRVESRWVGTEGPVSVLTWNCSWRRMERLLGWGFCSRGLRRRK